MFWIGAGLFAIGVGPLLLIIACAELGLTSDPNPNPVGPGMLAMLTFWPSVIMIVAGLIRAAVGRKH